MVTLSKNQVCNLIMLSYLSEKRLLEEKILLMEKKYNTNFEEFEKNLKNSTTENFSEWDDYIEWKAYISSYRQINNQIEDVKIGDFQLA